MLHERHSTIDLSHFSDKKAEIILIFFDHQKVLSVIKNTFSKILSIVAVSLMRLSVGNVYRGTRHWHNEFNIINVILKRKLVVVSAFNCRMLVSQQYNY